MSEAVTTTTVLLAGTREAIGRILNRAFRMCSSGAYMIADDDGLETINDKISAAVEFLDPVLRPILLEDIKNKWGYNKSAARDYMARPTYYRQKSRLETEIARGLGLV